jgi:hypothetical protein
MRRRPRLSTRRRARNTVRIIAGLSSPPLATTPAASRSGRSTRPGQTRMRSACAGEDYPLPGRHQDPGNAVHADCCAVAWTENSGTTASVCRLEREFRPEIFAVLQQRMRISCIWFGWLGRREDHKGCSPRASRRHDANAGTRRPNQADHHQSLPSQGANLAATCTEEILISATERNVDFAFLTTYSQFNGSGLSLNLWQNLVAFQATVRQPRHVSSSCSSRRRHVLTRLAPARRQLMLEFSANTMPLGSGSCAYLPPQRPPRALP